MRCFAAAAVMALATFGFTSSNVAAAAEPDCVGKVRALEAAWDAGGYTLPSKPSQAVVYGANGRGISGVSATAAYNAIRWANAACASGHAADSVALADGGLRALATAHGGPVATDVASVATK